MVWSHSKKPRKCGWCGGWHKGPCGKIVGAGRGRDREEVKRRGRGGSEEGAEGGPGVVGQSTFDFDGLAEGLAGGEELR